MTTTEQTPVEIDTKLADLNDELAKLNREHTWAVNDIMRTAGARRQYIGRSRVPSWSLSLEEASVKVAKAAEGSDYIARQASDAITKLAQVRDAIEAKRQEINKVAALYTGWNRFFVVTSSNGHIHSSTYCSTCYPTTTYGWLPYLSGKSQEEAIGHFGPAASCLCSVCFPDAPVEHKDQNLTQKQANDLLAGRTPEATPEKKYCPGSGERSATPINWRRVSPSGKCPHCGEVFAVTQDGKIRKHKEKKS